MKIQINNDIELQQLKILDSEDIFNIIDSQREYLGEWLPFVEFTKEMIDTLGFVESIVNAPEEKFEYVFTIRKNDEFVGLMGFKSTDNLNKKTEIGYWLSESFQGQGIITQATEKLCEFAFKTLGMNRIQIKCAVKNLPSIAIPKRLGFLLEGIERDGELLSGNKFTDLVVYSKLRTD